MGAPIRISLEDFVRGGSLGPLEIGLSRVEVEALFSLPDAWDARSQRIGQAAIWKYGDIELHFDRGRLRMIFLDGFSVPSGGDLDLDPWVISSRLSYAQAEQHLSEAGVAYRREAFPFNENGVLLIAGSGVTLSFAGQDFDHPTLHAIYRR